jgi:hypothetical protein
MPIIRSFLACSARLALVFLLPTLCAAAAVTTHHYDNFRTGWNWQETTLTASNVSARSFGLVGHVYLDEQVDAQPLVLSNQSINGTVHATVVYVATENNTVYAIDGVAGTVLAQVHLAETAAPISQIFNGSCGNNSSRIGINSTPVIDAAAGTLYVVTATIQSGALIYHLHALSVSTLQDKVTALTIATPSSSSFFRQRSALTLFNNGVLIPFTSFCDMGSSTVGFIVYANTTTTPAAQTLFGTSIFWLSSIWMSGSGPAVNGNYIYFATGNGGVHGQQGPPNTNLPDSLVRLQGSAGVPLSLTFSSFITPDSGIVGHDLDFGSGGVLIVPSGSPTSITSGTAAQFVTGAGKMGELYVNSLALGPTYVQGVSIGGDCHCGTSYFTGSDGHEYVVTSAGTTLGLYSVSASGLSLVGSAQLPAKAYGDPGFFTTVSSNQTASGSQLIWAVTGPDSRYKLWLYAYNALTLAPLFSAPVGSWGNVGGNANVVPVVANGHVYVASSGELSIWGPGIVDNPVMTEAGFPGQPGRVGFNLSLSEGSMSPATTSNGYTYQKFLDRYTAPNGVYSATVFAVSGFTSDPGSGWLVSASAEGVTYFGTQAATYTYASGSASWSWNGPNAFSGWPTQTTCTILHN